MMDVVHDISHHQHKPDFKRAKRSGQIGCIHKATEGTAYKDPTFIPRRGFIEDAGLLFGAYHFLTSSQPIQQAEHFLEVTGDTPLLVVDWETSNGKLPSVEVLSEFVRFIHNESRSLGFYVGQADLIEHFEEFDEAIQQCWLWVARYGKMPEVPLGKWKTWTMWQWTDGMHNTPQPVPGIGYCDRDRFNGSLSGLYRLWETIT